MEANPAGYCPNCTFKTIDTTYSREMCISFPPVLYWGIFHMFQLCCIDSFDECRSSTLGNGSHLELRILKTFPQCPSDVALASFAFEQRNSF